MTLLATIVAVGFAATLAASVGLARGVSIESIGLQPLLWAVGSGAIAFVLLAACLDVQAPGVWLAGTLAQPVALVLAAWRGGRGQH